jgi:hypothetical protein
MVFHDTLLWTNVTGTRIILCIQIRAMAIVENQDSSMQRKVCNNGEKE